MPATTSETRELRTAPPTALPAGPAAPRLARRYVERWLTTWGLGHLVPDAALVASELVTNAVTASSGPEVAIEVSSDGTTVRVRVGDDNPAPPPLPPRPRVASAGLAEHGYGLIVVARVALACGWEPEDHEDGKAVWAECAL